jgi:REP element-mobilizing transposase RayT
VVFTSDSDIAAYAHWLKEGASKYEVSIHGWVFMTNHVHLLLRPGHDDSVSKLFQYLGRLYVRFFKLWGHPLSDDGEFLPKNKAGWAVTRTDP